MDQRGPEGTADFGDFSLGDTRDFVQRRTSPSECLVDRVPSALSKILYRQITLSAAMVMRRHCDNETELDCDIRQSTFTSGEIRRPADFLEKLNFLGDGAVNVARTFRNKEWNFCRLLAWDEICYFGLEWRNSD